MQQNSLEQSTQIWKRKSGQSCDISVFSDGLKQNFSVFPEDILLVLDEGLMDALYGYHRSYHCLLKGRLVTLLYDDNDPIREFWNFVA